MPYLSITTSTDLFETIQATLIHRASQLVAEGLGKAETHVAVSWQHARMQFGAADAPSGFLELRNVGAITEAARSALTRKLSQLLSKEADIPIDRIHIHFMEVLRSEWGWNGKTLAES